MSNFGRRLNLAAKAAAAAFTRGYVPSPSRDTYADYLDERNAKIALSEKQSEFLDKSLLTLGGGALGLFLTFLHDHDRITADFIVAKVGLASLVSCIVAVLLSDLSKEDADAEYKQWCAEGKPGPDNDRKKVEPKQEHNFVIPTIPKLPAPYFLLPLILLPFIGVPA